RLWDAHSGEDLGRLPGHPGQVFGVAFAPAPLGAPGEAPRWRLASCSAPEGAVRLWEVPSGRPLAVLPGGKDGHKGAAFRPDGRLVAAGDGEGRVQLWNAATEVLIATLAGHSMRVERVAFSPDGRLLASAAGDGAVRLWDVATGRPQRSFAAHAGGVNG